MWKHTRVVIHRCVHTWGKSGWDVGRPLSTDPQDACEGLAEVLHTIIAGDSCMQAVKLSELSLQTVADLLVEQNGRELSEAELKETEEIQQELDVQWQIYRALKEAEKHNVEMISDLKNELREVGVSNICVKIDQ